MSCVVQASRRQNAYLCLVKIVVVDLRKGYGEEENSAEEESGMHDNMIDRLFV